MAGGSRRELQLGQGLALGVSLVSGRILMRLCLAELDLVVIVQHGSGRLLRLLGNDIDHQAALLGDFPDIGFGGIGLAQLGLIGEQSVGHRFAPVKMVNAEVRSKFQFGLPCRSASPRCEVEKRPFRAVLWDFPSRL